MSNNYYRISDPPFNRVNNVFVYNCDCNIEFRSWLSMNRNNASPIPAYIQIFLTSSFLHTTIRSVRNSH